MPVYEHECDHCGRMELVRRMADPAPRRCPRCDSRQFRRIYGNVHFHGACDAGQENENDGLGMFYPELGKEWIDPYTKTRKNPDTHARSRADAIEKFKRRGYSVEKC